MTADIAPGCRAEPGKRYYQAARMSVAKRTRHIHSVAAAAVDVIGVFHTWYGRTKLPSHMHSSWDDTADEAAHNSA